MIRTTILTTAVVAGLLTTSGIAAGPAATVARQAGQATPAEAAPFIGEWTLALEGQNGPATFNLTVKVEKDKVVGEIGGMGQAVQPIADVALVSKSLTLRYSFDYQGNAVDAVVSLTPGAEGKVSAQIDFAGGAYVVSGTATKKAK